MKLLRGSCLALLTLFALGVVSPVRAITMPCFGACFSVSGKKGAYVPTVDAVTLTQSRKLVAGVTPEVRSLGEHALNKGEYAGYGLSMPETEKALQGLLREIYAASNGFNNLKPLPEDVKIHIVAATYYGPSAQPDNSIIIPLGLLQRAHSRDEVAWLLSHEYSHVALAHFAKDANLENRKLFIDKVVNAMTTALEASRLRAQDTSAGVHLYMVRDPAETRRVKAVEGYQANLRLMIKLYGQALSRDQEDRADAAGVDFATKAGWDAEDGAKDALKEIADDDARAAKSAQTLNAMLKDVAAGSVTPKALDALRNGNMSEAFGDFFTSVGRNGEAVLLQQAVQALSASHRPTAQRQVGVHNYAHDAYPTIDRSVDKTWIATVQATREFQVADAAVRAHDSAEALLDADKPGEALAALKPAQDGKYANAPFIANMTAKIYTAMGNIPLADQLYDRAEASGVRAAPVAAPPPPAPRAKPVPTAKRRAPAGRPQPAAAPAAPAPVAAPAVAAPGDDDPFMRQSLEGYGEHVSLLTAHGLYPKAKLKIAEAEHRFGDHEAFLPDLIFMAVKGGKSEEMQAYLDECRKTQNDSLWERCRIAVLDDSQKAQLDKLSPEQRAKLDRSLERRHEDDNRAQAWKKLLDGFNKSQSAPAL